MMKVILQEDVSNLGVVGDLVNVRDGYARNFLIPNGMAIFASNRSVRQLEHQKRLAQHKRKLAQVQAEDHKKKIEGLSICMSAKVAAAAIGEDGKPVQERLPKLYGSITNRDVAGVLKGLGVEVDARRIQLSDVVRTVGKFAATVRLDGGIVAKIPFWVIAEGVPDVEAEKKRVEAAQEAVKKEAEEAAAREAKLAAQAAQAAKAEAQETAAKAAEGEAAPAEAEGGEGEAKPKKSKSRKAKTEEEAE